MTARTSRKRNALTESKEVDEAENDAAEQAQDTIEPLKKDVKKVPIKLVVDNSKEKIGIMHYLAMFVWLGWPSFYLALMLTFPLLYIYARPVLIAIILVLATSAIYPIDSRKQPKVCQIGTFSHTHHTVRLTCVFLDCSTVGHGPRSFHHEVSQRALHLSITPGPSSPTSSLFHSAIASPQTRAGLLRAAYLLRGHAGSAGPLPRAVRHGAARHPASQHLQLQRHPGLLPHPRLSRLPLLRLLHVARCCTEPCSPQLYWYSDISPHWLQACGTSTLGARRRT